MVDPVPSIIDQPLPDALNFRSLKNLGIQQLKQLVGNTWSNYNDSDPGVTILDQLCYALTELGYCAEFPVEDVLTGADGKIRYEGQFFEPQDILTCSPVTVDDYRRLIHDCMPDVEAIYITPQTLPVDGAGEASMLTGRYRTYLYFRPMLQAEKQLLQLHSSIDTHNHQRLKQVHARLNSCRNLGEFFVTPQLLAAQKITLVGTLVLAPSADISVVQSQLIEALNSYAVPPVIRSGYCQLRDQGLAGDEIFNGPRLTQGWINGTDGLPDKTPSINLFELNIRLAALDGVEQVKGLAFSGAHEGASAVAIAADEVAEINSTGLVLTHSALHLQPKAPGPTAHYLSQMRLLHKSAAVASAVDPYPPKLAGRYRNIESYYSVQNTFPEIYRIGVESSQAHLQTASTRQLKGYLMVYDQLLANQFSQLSHVGDLFSFKPKASAPDSASVALACPAFQVTYHCQPLYDTPGVMPLLRGNTAFRFQTDPQQPAELVERDAWQRFRQQPFNAYLHGLRSIMETAPKAYERRDQMLSHLMARHGDQASVYNEMLKTCYWFGNEVRTRCIVKSIWLQNYQKLSSAQNGAFDIAFAKPLQALPGVGRPRNKSSDHQHGLGLPTVAGQLDEALIYARAQLAAADFANFSTFELKTNILLGLAEHLLGLCANLEALLESKPFASWLVEVPGESNEHRLENSDLWVRQVNGEHQLYASQPVDGDRQQPLLVISAAEASPVAHVSGDDYRSYLELLYWLATQRKGCMLIEHLLLLPTHEAGSAPFFLSASLIVPDFVGVIRQGTFKVFIDSLVERHWPAHIGLRYMTMNQADLRKLITYFVSWHNSSMGSKPRDHAAQKLVELLGIVSDREAGDVV
ncbi:hypothetical protein ACTAB9_09595 [Pseudomonas syringae]|uniref:hypothetical protein n=1 Tax=Pseudomonas syringae TaxID=317 RepID=UPI003F74DE7F